MIISWSVMLRDKLLHFVLILFITALSAFHIHLAFWIRHLQTYILCPGKASPPSLLLKINH